MSHTCCPPEVFAQLLDRLVALQGREVMVQVSAPSDPEGFVAFVGTLGGWASEDPDRDDVIFIPVTPGGIALHRRRLTAAVLTPDGLIYALDGVVAVKIEPTTTLLPGPPESGR